MESPTYLAEKPLKKRRTLERTPYHLVERPTDLVYVGDLNGRLLALHKNCEFAGILDESHNWIGGNKILVFTGDLIGDRHTDGLKIMLEISRLRIQARKAGGDIVLIAGNHDDLFISYLRDAPAANQKIQLADGSFFPENRQDTVAICRNENMGNGLTELLKYLPEQKNIEGKQSRFDLLFKDQVRPRQLAGLHEKGFYKNAEILENMQRDPEGIQILETLCSYNLLFQIDDNLARHCPLNVQMSDLIEIYGIDTLNDLYKSVLRRDLLGENIKISKSMQNLFEQMRTAFLSTDNRQYLNDENIDFALSQRGINFDVHGHNPEGGKVYKIGSNIHCANIDFGAFYNDAWDPNFAICSLAIIEASSAQISLGNPKQPIILRRDEKEITLKIRGITNKVRALTNSLERQESPEVRES